MYIAITLSRNDEAILLPFPEQTAHLLQSLNVGFVILNPSISLGQVADRS